ncbi:MAG: cytochrome b/b6 domain-containing protein [Deltaproteobacteria bacterium]|nr:cytochrome b/b6 domain-containing protein [Deltaproteobacteria bacterium]
MGSLIYRHNRITRCTHWINALALLILFMSGLQIFNAYPHLHWGSKAEPEEAFFSIYAATEDGEIRGYTQFFGWRVETTGLFGVQHTEMGPFPRAFPSWVTIPGYFWLAGGRRWHFFFAWLFALNGLLYLIYNLASGHLRKFLLTPKDITKILPMILYYLRLRRESPQEGEYNPLQKMAYTGALLVLTPLIVLSGLALSPQLNVAFNWLPAMFGGRQSARAFHFLFTFFFAAFTFGHIVMVVATGLLNNMRSIVTGWYREKQSSESPGTLQPLNPSTLEPLDPETSSSLSLRAEGLKRSEDDSDTERPDVAPEKANIQTPEEQSINGSKNEDKSLNPENLQGSEDNSEGKRSNDEKK